VLRWQELASKGIKTPGAISNHSSVLHNNKMYLYGGSSGLSTNSTFYALDMNTLLWEPIKTRGDVPPECDEHTAVVHGEEMIIFGGFVDGERTNNTHKYSFKDNAWQKVAQVSDAIPCARAGHSAVVVSGSESSEDYMYVFGGRDNEDRKLNDLWRMSLASN